MLTANRFSLPAILKHTMKILDITNYFYNESHLFVPSMFYCSGINKHDDFYISPLTLCVCVFIYNTIEVLTGDLFKVGGCC